jgi:photosynthetic reaction center cytochrome c subunit
MSVRVRQVFACVAAAAVFVMFVSVLQAARLQAPTAARPPAQLPAAQAAPQAPQGPKASEKYMNLKVLGDMPATQLHDAMVFMEASLGFTCESCHVRKPDGEFAWEKDDKDNKVTARRMLELTKGLNTQYFDGQPDISCATCHQGRRSPVNLPPALLPFTADQLAMQAAQAALPPGTRPPAPKETADQVIAKYYEAIGGEAAAQKTSSAVMRGTAVDRAGASFPATVTEKAPGRYRISIEAKTPISRGFDGTTAWMKNGDTARDLAGIDLLALARDASPWIAARLKPSFIRFQVGRYERIDGHDVITLNGTVSPDVTESLSFDRESGLLVRRLSRLRTVLGRLQVQIDYADYRAVDGVKVPFEVRIADWESVTTLKFSEVKLNAPVEDSTFGRH